MCLDAFVEEARRRNLRNSVFVDNTASDVVAAVYGRLLEKSIAVVACNKIACSGLYADYVHLKNLARDFNTSGDHSGENFPVVRTTPKNTTAEPRGHTSPSSASRPPSEFLLGSAPVAHPNAAMRRFAIAPGGCC